MEAAVVQLRVLEEMRGRLIPDAGVDVVRRGAQARKRDHKRARNVVGAVARLRFGNVFAIAC